MTKFHPLVLCCTRRVNVASVCSLSALAAALKASDASFVIWTMTQRIAKGREPKKNVRRPQKVAKTLLRMTISLSSSPKKRLRYSSQEDKTTVR